MLSSTTAKEAKMYDYDDYISDNDYDDSHDFWGWQYGEDESGWCDRCGEDTPNGHGHYINDDTERVCGDCYDKEAGK